MKSYLQNIIKSIYEQKRVALFIFTIVVYITVLAFIKADAEAEEMAEVTKKITFNTTASAAQELKVQLLSNEYKEMLDGLDETKLKTIEVIEADYYSEYDEEINTGVLHNSEEGQFIETLAIGNIDTSEAAYTPEEFRYHGTFRWNGSKWTWYSEKVLPGGGLNIPGRHLDEESFVCDEDDYICLAADTEYLSKGTIVDTPFGRPGKIYDCGCAYGTIDVYVGW